MKSQISVQKHIILQNETDFALQKKLKSLRKSDIFFRPKTGLKSHKTVTPENFFQCVYLEDMVV